MIVKNAALRLRLSIGVLILLITCMHSFVNAQTGIGVPSFHACDSLVQAFITKWSIPGATVALVISGGNVAPDLLAQLL